MIIFFGPAGSGKSTQGKILAARLDWRWLSAGQLLRESNDPEVLKTQQEGRLVDIEKVNEVVGYAINQMPNTDSIILDGYPRTIDQAHWLVEKQPLHAKSINLIIVLELSRVEAGERIQIRGRADDSAESFEARIQSYNQEIYPLLNYFADQGVSVVHIDGSGTVGQIHDRVMEELVACKIV